MIKNIFFYPFWANLVKKIKINLLRYNFVSSLIRICWIWCSCLHFLFWTENTIFGQIWYKKIKIVFLRWNLGSRPIRICGIQWWFYFFRKYSFWANLVQTFKITYLRWKLVPKLFRICWICFYDSETPFLSKFG